MCMKMMLVFIFLALTVQLLSISASQHHQLFNIVSKTRDGVEQGDTRPQAISQLYRRGVQPHRAGPHEPSLSSRRQGGACTEKRGNVRKGSVQCGGHSGAGPSLLEEVLIVGGRVGWAPQPPLSRWSLLGTTGPTCHRPNPGSFLFKSFPPPLSLGPPWGACRKESRSLRRV